MVFERGPKAFLDGSGQLLHDYLFHGTGMQSLTTTASAHISERIIVLTSLRYSLATFLAQVRLLESTILFDGLSIINLSFVIHQVYVEVDKIGEQILKEPEKSVTSLIRTINALFLELETSIGHVSAIRQVILHFSFQFRVSYAYVHVVC